MPFQINSLELYSFILFSTLSLNSVDNFLFFYRSSLFWYIPICLILMLFSFSFLKLVSWHEAQAGLELISTPLSQPVKFWSGIAVMHHYAWKILLLFVCVLGVLSLLTLISFSVFFLFSFNNLGTRPTVAKEILGKRTKL